VTVAFALQLAESVILLGLAIGLTALGISDSQSGGTASVTGSELATFSAVVGVLTAVLLVVAYFFSYARMRDGEYEDARTPTLALGIIFVLLVVTLPIGILYLMAYARLSTAERQDLAVSLLSDF